MNIKIPINKNCQENVYISHGGVVKFCRMIGFIR